MPHDAQRRHVVALADFGRELRDARHHRRHDVQRIRVVLVDELERALGVELAAEHDVIACEQRGDRPDERSVVVQRSGHQMRPVDLHPEQRSRVGVDQARLVGENQLRPAGRAARRHRFVRVRDRVGHRTVVEPVCVQGTLDDDSRTRELDDGVELASGKPRGDGLRNRAELPARDRRRHERGAIRQRDGHHVVLTDTLRRERPGGAVGQRLELGPGQHALLVGQRRMVGVDCDVLGESLRIRDQGHGRDSGAPPHRRTADLSQRNCDSSSQHPQQASR